jgi:hypothetical protein
MFSYTVRFPDRYELPTNYVFTILLAIVVAIDVIKKQFIN